MINLIKISLTQRSSASSRFQSVNLVNNVALLFIFLQIEFHASSSDRSEGDYRDLSHEKFFFYANFSLPE